MWQAEHVAAALRQAHPGLAVEILGMTTQGDKILDTPLAKIGGKGLFVKELEQGMLNGEADIAVHSMKDVPVELPEGLHLAVILEREDPRDAFVSNHHASLVSLPEGARVGTSSLRRQCQLADRRPDLEIVPLRGNVNTRLRKLDDSEYDAIILAAAGLLRLGFAERIRSFIDTDDSLPAIGQGAIGIEYRANDDETAGKLAPLNHLPTFQQVTAERALLARLDGSCRTPIGVHTIIEDGLLTMNAEVLSPDGAERHRETVAGLPENAELLGNELGLALIDMAGQAFFDRLRGL